MSVKDLPINSVTSSGPVFPVHCYFFLSKVLSWDDSRKTDGFYDLSIQFQLSLLDHGYEVFHQACFLLDGVSHGAICDAVYVGDV